MLVANDETYAEKGPGHAVTMTDGWEARRRRGGGCDWLLLHLGVPGEIRKFSVDTMRFVGNSPGAIRLTATDSTDAATAALPAEEWPELRPRTGIQPDTRHWFGRDAGLDTERTVDRNDMLAALAGHARIGQAPTGKGREAVSSRQEQAGVADDPALHAALVEGNRAYEQRFGHVYLVRAAAQSGEEMPALLRERLGNDDVTERDVVGTQLAEITSLRLRRLWGEGAA